MPISIPNNPHRKKMWLCVNLLITAVYVTHYWKKCHIRPFNWGRQYYTFLIQFNTCTEIGNKQVFFSLWLLQYLYNSKLRVRVWTHTTLLDSTTFFTVNSGKCYNLVISSYRVLKFWRLLHNENETVFPNPNRLYI